MNNILLLIQEAYPNLPRSEKKVADFILKNPYKVLDLNAQELATMSESSSAAVMRLTKSIGVDGFSNLKFQLKQIPKESQSNYSEIIPQDTPTSIGNKLFTRLTYSLEKTQNAISDEVIKTAVEFIDKGARVYLFGLGASSLVAQDLFQKFSRINVDVFFSEDYHIIATSMANQPPESVLISISNSGEKYLTNKISQVAKNLLFNVISITSDSESTLAKISDIVLATNTTEEFKLKSTATVSMIAQMYLADLLFLSYASHHFDSSLKLLEASKKITDELDDL